jgi:hypothetical protein
VWRSSFYARLTAHLQEACATIGEVADAVDCARPLPTSTKLPFCFTLTRTTFFAAVTAAFPGCFLSGCTCGSCGAPPLLAFTGKRQYLELLNIDASGKARKGKAKVASAAVQLGPQPPDSLPHGWPLPPSCEVWVCTSTSGAAAMSNADRERPYKQLAEQLQHIPWPRPITLKCHSQ